MEELGLWIREKGSTWESLVIDTHQLIIKVDQPIQRRKKSEKHGC